jgi:hypothetical protein
MPSVTESRRIFVRGPLLPDNSGGLWEGTFDLAYAHYPHPDPIGDLARGPALRVLLQDAQSHQLVGNDPDFAEPFHDPRLLQGAVKADNTTRGDSKLSIAGSREDTVLPLAEDFSHPGGPAGSDTLNEGVPFAQVHLVPVVDTPKVPDKRLADWPQKTSRELELAPTALVRGDIPVGIWSGKSTRITKRLFIEWPAAGGAFASAFNGLFRIKMRRVAGGIIYLPVRLVPEGVELDVQMTADRAMPDGASAAEELQLRLRLEVQSTPVKASAYRLVLIGGADWPRLRARFDRIMPEFAPRDSLLTIDASPGIPPLFWQLEEDNQHRLVASDQENGSPPVWSVEIDPERVRASVRTEPPRGADVPAVAALRLAGAKITQRSNANKATLRLSGGEAPPKQSPALLLAWRSSAAAFGTSASPVEVSLGRIADTDAETPALSPFDAVAETTELGGILLERYTAAHVMPPGLDPPLYAFLPLERGQLQLRLPNREEAAAAEKKAKKDVSPRTVFAGLIRGLIDLANGGRNDATAPKAIVEVVGAQKFVARMSIDRSGSTFSGSMVLSGVHGRLLGSLWACEASPSPAEILPSLDAGPTSVRTLPVVFGVPNVVGWELTVAPLDKKQPDSISLVALGSANTPAAAAPVSYPGAIAWLCHPKLPLVSAIAMTRTAGNARRPSISRDLVPCRIEGTPEQRTIVLTPSNSMFPQAAPAKIQDTLGWPWPSVVAGPDEAPEEGVSMVPVTLPGVEYSTPKPFAFATLWHSLRYDLPILGELYAGAVLKREDKPREEQQPTDPRETPTALDPNALARAWARASNRLALTRTMLDRVVPWGENRDGIKVTTLLEPFVWRTGFKVEADSAEKLPLGRYRLGTKDYEAANALAGLQTKFKTPADGESELNEDEEGTIAVVGFAIGLWQQERDTPEGVKSLHHIDTRGFTLQSVPEQTTEGTPLAWRAAGLMGGAKHRYVTTREPIKLTFPWDAVEVGLHVRDLAMRLSAGAWEFDGKESPEQQPGPTGDSYKRGNVVCAVHEWRIITGGITLADGSKSEPHYALALGPLRFRPLRLHSFKLKPGAAGFVTDRAVVIGTVGGPDIADAGSDPEARDLPRDEQAYRSGNLIALEFTASDHGLRLTALHKVAVKASGVEIDAAAPARVTFAGLAAVSYPPAAARVGAEKLAFELGLDLTLHLGALRATKVMLKARMFGRSVEIAGKDADLTTNELVVGFDPPSDTQTASRLRTDTLNLTWKSADDHAELSISARAILVPDGGPADFVVLGLGGTLDWLSSRHGSINAGLPWRIDHITGVIDAELKLDATTAMFLLRGMPLPPGSIRGMAALAVADAPSAAKWPDFALSAGLVEFIFTEASGAAGGTLILRQCLTGRTIAAGQAEWMSTLIVSAGRRAFASGVKWPIGALPNTLLDATAYQPRHDKEADWITTNLPIAAGTPELAHKVTAWIKDVEFPASLIGKVEDRTYALAKPWRFKAVTEHRIGEGTGHVLSWSAINELTLIDIAKLRDTLATVTYAFAARYVDGDTKVMKAAGVVERAFGRAGLPGKEIVEVLKAAGSGVNGLLISGAGVTDIVTTPAEAKAGQETVPHGVTVTMPWLCAWDAAAANLGPLDNIPQAPASGAATTMAVSRFDLANAIPQPLHGSKPVSFAAGDGSSPLMRRQLDSIFGVDRMVFGADALRPSMPVDQAFSGIKPAPTNQAILERPLFLRSLCGLKRVMAVVPGDRTLSARTIMATSTRPGRALAITVEIKTQKLAEQPSGSWELIVLARHGVSAVALPDRDYDKTSADERRHLGRIAFSCAAEPLSIQLGQIDDPRDAQDMSLHSQWLPIALPPQLDPPPQPHALRSRGETLFASPALGWPAAYRSGEAAGFALRLGDERPIQDPQYAWAGRARSLSGPAYGWAGANTPQGDTDRAIFLALGRRVLFRRASQSGFRAPPDRALTPIPPRARAPLPAPIQGAISDNLAKPANMNAPPRRVAPLLPSQFEIVDTGVRAGVLSMEHDGYILTSGPAGFDPDHDRFGRPADRGPIAFRQVRAPRSSLLPVDETVGETTPPVIDIARRRRTFVAQDELAAPGRLKPFKVVRGPAAVLRYIDRDGNRAQQRDEFVSTTIRVIDPNLGRLSARWNGVIELEATSAATEGLATELARVGLLAPKPVTGETELRAEFVIGDARFLFATIAQKPIDEKARVILTLSMADAADQHAAARLALDASTPDTPVALVIRLAPLDRNRAAPGVNEKVPLQRNDPSVLPPGPPRTLRLPLSRVPVDRPWLPVETATLAFGDPAYDRRLGSPAKITPQVVADKRYVLAADRAEYDLGETIYFAAGRLLPGDDMTLPSFEQTAPPPLTNWTITFALQPKPSPSGETREEIPLSVAGIKASPRGDPKGRSYAHAIDAGRSYAVALSSLREGDEKTQDTGPARIEPGDRLVLVARFGSDVELRLDLGVVPDPVIAPAEATYSLVTLQASKKSVYDSATPALFASAPLPQSIEFPNLLGDLALGHVRRRALFLWYFVPRSVPAFELGYLVKYDRSGGGQLPKKLEDFQGMEGL